MYVEDTFVKLNPLTVFPLYLVAIACFFFFFVICASRAVRHFFVNVFAFLKSYGFNLKPAITFFNNIMVFLICCLKNILEAVCLFLNLYYFLLTKTLLPAVLEKLRQLIDELRRESKVHKAANPLFYRLLLYFAIPALICLFFISFLYCVQLEIPRYFAAEMATVLYTEGLLEVKPVRPPQNYVYNLSTSNKINLRPIVSWNRKQWKLICFTSFCILVAIFVAHLLNTDSARSFVSKIAINIKPKLYSSVSQKFYEHIESFVASITNKIKNNSCVEFLIWYAKRRRKKLEIICTKLKVYGLIIIKPKIIFMLTSVSSWITKEIKDWAQLNQTAVCNFKRYGLAPLVISLYIVLFYDFYLQIEADFAQETLEMFCVSGHLRVPADNLYAEVANQAVANVNASEPITKSFDVFTKKNRLLQYYKNFCKQRASPY